MPSFGELLREARQRAGLTQTELAARASLSMRGIQDLERGVRRRPHPASARQLADALRLSGEDRRALMDAAVGSAPGATSIGLPPRTTSFVGRGTELARIAQLLLTSRLITLCGAGGVGKTRLALEVAFQASAGQPFEDDVCLVELAEIRDAELIPSAVANALGLREVRRSSIGNAVRDYLRDRAVLVVLDNCEHQIDACAQLVLSLRGSCPSLTILATSREPLDVDGEIVWPLAPLEIPDPKRVLSPEHVLDYPAVRLFVDRACAAQPNFELTIHNAASVAGICARLQGLPLALELAAARIRALPPRQLLDQLARGFDVLARPSRGVLPRHQTLRTTI